MNYLTHKDLNAKHLIVSFIILLLGIFIVLPLMQNAIVESTGDTITPDSSHFVQADELETLSSCYGPDGRFTYVWTRWTYDLLWPLLYLQFLLVYISFLSSSLSIKMRKVMMAIPLVAVLLDILENSFFSLYMIQFDRNIAFFRNAGCLISAGKWVVIFIAFALILVVFLLKIINKIKTLKLR